MTKICKTCEVEKEIEEFYFNKKTERFSTECKICTRIRTKRNREQNGPYERKPLGPKQQEAHRIACRAYVGRNREEINRKQRGYNNTPERRQYMQEYNANPINQPRIKESKKKYITEKPERRAATFARYQSQKFGTECKEVTARDLARLINRWNGLCAYCQEAPYHDLDHIFPLSRGGRHSIGNLLPACRSCNLHKTNSLIVEWRNRDSQIRLFPNTFSDLRQHLLSNNKGCP